MSQENILNESQHDKSNIMICAPSEDSDQPGHPPSLIRVFAVRSMVSYFMRAAKTLIRLVVSCCDSNFVFYCSCTEIYHIYTNTDGQLMQLQQNKIQLLSQHMRLWYLSHRRLAKAKASLRIRAISPEPSLFAHMKYGSKESV